MSKLEETTLQIFKLPCRVSFPVLMLGDSADLMTEIPDESISAVITDFPYQIGLMNLAWDRTVPFLPIFKQCFRVLKPGAFLVGFTGQENYHKFAVELENAGFEINCMNAWIYASSAVPHGMNLVKKLIKDDHPEIWGYDIKDFNYDPKTNKYSYILELKGKRVIKSGIVPADKLKYTNNVNVLKTKLKYTSEMADYFGYSVISYMVDEKRETYTAITRNHADVDKIIKGTWTTFMDNVDGYNTGIKPSFEPILIAKKPTRYDVIETAKKYGTGIKNVDATRIPFDGMHNVDMVKLIKDIKALLANSINKIDITKYNVKSEDIQALIADIRGQLVGHNNDNRATTFAEGFNDSLHPAGNTRCNDLEKIADILEGVRKNMSGDMESRMNVRTNSSSPFGGDYMDKQWDRHTERTNVDDTIDHLAGRYPTDTFLTTPNILGKQSKFFLVPKPTSKEKDLLDVTINPHQTVKPIDLMTHLVKLYGGAKVGKEKPIVLDPFMGSGTTLIACKLSDKLAIGIDITKEYFDFTVRRVKEYGSQGVLW